MAKTKAVETEAAPIENTILENPQPETAPNEPQTPDPDMLTAQLKELTELEVTHKMFGAYWEQATRALAASNPTRAAQWLEQGLSIARGYTEQVNSLVATANALQGILENNKKMYFDIIAELQSIASKPADTSYVDAYKRIASLEEGARGKKAPTDHAAEIETLREKITQLQQEIQQQKPTDYTLEIERLESKNTALEAKISSLEYQKDTVLEAVDDRVKALLRSHKDKEDYDAR